MLPVRLSSVQAFLKGKSEVATTWVISLVEVLNFHATMGKMRTGPAVMTAAQELMVTRLLRAVDRFLERGGLVASLPIAQGELGCVRFDYGGEPVHYMEDLEAAKVIPCWPKKSGRQRCRMPGILYRTMSVNGLTHQASVCFLSPSGQPRSRIAE